MRIPNDETTRRRVASGITVPTSQQCSSSSVPQEQRRVHTTGDHKMCLRSQPDYHKLTVHPQTSPKILLNMPVTNSQLQNTNNTNYYRPIIQTCRPITT